MTTKFSKDKISQKIQYLEKIINDPSTTDGEKENAKTLKAKMEEKFKDAPSESKIVFNSANFLINKENDLYGIFNKKNKKKYICMIPQNKNEFKFVDSQGKSLKSFSLMKLLKANPELSEFLLKEIKKKYNIDNFYEFLDSTPINDKLFKFIISKPLTMAIFIKILILINSLILGVKV